MFAESPTVRTAELDDERAEDRARVASPARLLCVDGHDGASSLTTRLLNLSEQGAAIRTFGHVEPGTTGRLVVFVAGGPVVAPVRVMWTRMLAAGRICGLRFERLTPSQQEAIDRIVDANVYP